MFEDNLDERYGLAFERIKQINSDCDILQDGFCEYFKRVSGFIIEMDKLKHNIDTKYYENAALEELQRVNTDLYKDVLDSTDAYDKSFANPSYACERLGLDYGRLLSFLYIEIRGMIVYAYEKRTAQMTAVAELFVEIYCMFEQADSLPEYQSVLDCVYWYVSDYSDDMIEYRISEMLNPDYSFATDIIMNSDLNDLRYLYQFGEYITDNEIKTARYLNSLSQSEIESMAATFTEGYRIGFELGNKDISKKKTVNIRYCIGFERLVREEIKQFEKIGLKSTIYRAAADSINKKMHIKIGYVSTSPNKQMDYDHRFDNALYLDSQFVERKLGALKLAYEKNKTYAAEFGGPAVMEIFGEVPFEPVDKPESLRLDEKQQKLSVKYNNEASAIVNTYIKGEERSFTIIAYPIPEIGDNYEQIFNETVKINTLDYDKYKVIQQNIIDALDGADYVSVKGCNGNTTDMRVSIMPIADMTSQTVFENCLADVNIPLGEVFTSPVLKNTTGRLNVSQVYLNDLKFKNLTVEFRDGFVTGYNCDNFADEDKNKAFFKENVLYNHDTLPIGEFAIGTNTTAYVMANKYDIVYKLPILIVEKMGPHFAIGDTCYSRSEDIVVFNPNGKEIISRDNEVSLLRKTQPEKAYFNCHTDITIPYDEIGSISAIHSDGKEIKIIENGRFVLEGCEELNKPFNC
jgi:aminopeptidase